MSDAVAQKAGMIAPGGTIGILGGGQLGRMLALAAARLGLQVHIYAPEDQPPAGQVCAAVTQAAWGDADALARFAASVDVISYEFENIPVATAETLAALTPLRPGVAALRAAQDRVEEKGFLEGIGLTVAPWAAVDSLDDLKGALARIGTPAILKTRRMGYDGKGQVRIDDPVQAEDALKALAGAPAVLEGFVSFESEVSVIAARGLRGEVVCFDPGENVHLSGILHTTTIPAAIPARLKADAALAAGRILNALDYVGVMGVEVFVTKAGLVINEIAPRVHNSGHWTQDACAVDQFEQHIRAICGWPLGDGSRVSDAVMTNLIGDDAHDWPAIAAEPGARLHLYGKAEARAGRKMGHVNRVTSKA
jgi:5-(carboxyamino)imidazole ribonucleotide synthase